MEILSTLVTGFVGFLTVLVFYVVFMSRKFLTFRKTGVKSLTPLPAIGNFLTMGKMGITEFHKSVYNQFKGEKVYGIFEGGNPILVIRDLEIIRGIMVKNFNNFVNRRTFSSEEPINHAMTALKDDHWRHVRNSVSPTFSSGKLKKMCLLVEQTAKSLTSNLRKASEEGREIELKHLVGCYTMDVIANTGFGVSIDSLNDESCPFVEAAKEVTNFGNGAIALILLFPFLINILNKFGYTIFSKSSTRFFNSFLDAAMENRKSGEAGSQKRHDFVQLIVEEESKQKESNGSESNGSSGEVNHRERKGLSHLEIQGQAFIFILAGYDTVSTTMAFTFSILAHKPDITRKVQEEIDDVLQGKPATYDNVNELVYLDMCLNEAMRKYPPGFIIDRMCTEDCEIEGVQFKKGQVVLFPLIAIYNDPEYFPNPEEFDPERFTPENKASRHPFAFLPFGQGPRNCIGMRLALMEMKIALASVLKEMTPVPCSKSVYPPKLKKFQLSAEDGLWVKFVPRKED